MPSLRRRDALLRSGGWFHVNNVVAKTANLKLSNRFCCLDFDGKPGSLPHADLDEKAMLSRRPVVVATRHADSRTKKLATQLNRQVLNDTNVLHSVLCGWPTFNKWTPPHKFLSKRWQCHFNFSVRTDRKAWCYPERRFIRFCSNTNKLDYDLIKSTESLLQRVTGNRLLIKKRIEILNRWLFGFGTGDFRLAMPNERKIPRSHGSNTLLDKLFACRRMLSMKAG